MIKSFVEQTFQKVSVGTQDDELRVTVNRLRGEVSDLRHVIRELVQQLDGLRTELDAVRANGVPAPTNGATHTPTNGAVIHLEAPAPVVAPAVAVQAPTVQAAPAVQAAPKAPAAPEAPAAEVAPAEDAPAATGSIAASIADAATGQAPPPDTGGLNPLGINYAADGVAFWGLLNNESSRARAAGMKLIIDQWECISCGTCVEQTDEVFVLPDDAKAVPLKQEGPMDLIQDAIDACPVTCIHWAESEDAFEQLNDAEGRALSAP